MASWPHALEQEHYARWFQYIEKEIFIFMAEIEIERDRDGGSGPGVRQILQKLYFQGGPIAYSFWNFPKVCHQMWTTI